MIIELTTFIPNVAGQFNRVLETIYSQNVNVIAFSIDQAGPYSAIRLIVSDVEKTRKALEDKAFVLEQNDVLAVGMKHQPGELMRVTNLLTEAGFNIDYGYLTVTVGADDAVVLLRTNNQDEASKFLLAAGVDEKSSLDDLK